MVAMRTVSLLSAVVVVSATATLAETAHATPESRAAALFLLISPSVRVNGMGQAGVALIDEPGGYYNPASVPLANPEHTIQSRFYLTAMDWLGLTYSYMAAQVTSERLVRDDFLGDRLLMRASLHGFRTKLDLGTWVVTGERGEVVGSFERENHANHLGVGLAFSSVVDVGIGITAKRITSKLSPQDKGSGNAYDLGFLVRVPVVRVLERITRQSLAVKGYMHPVFDVGYGMSWRNRGSKINFGGGFSDPLPRNRNRGWSANLGFEWRSEALRLSLAHATVTEETYRPEVEGADITDRSEDDKSGAELELLETIAFRSGEYSDYDGDVFLNTSGLTLRSDGLFKIVAALLKTDDAGPEQEALRYLLEHLSVSWSRFEYEDRGDGNPLGEISHTFVGLSF